MRDQVILLSLLSSLIATGCKQLECGEGTIERDGICVQPTTSADGASCGPFTRLEGDRCVPEFPPTVCEDGTTEAEVDPETGVTTCKGTGGGGCGVPIACPTPTSSSRMTICGQLYDFETNMPFAATNATGAPCDPQSPTADGPCALGVRPYDALAFADNPTTAQPLPHTEMVIDDCGRYRVKDIDLNGTGPYIGLGIDDIANPGPSGVTVTSAIAIPKVLMGASRGVEAWIVKPSTVALWGQNNGPSLTTGIYAPVYRAHKLGNGDPFANQMGVTFTPAKTTYYFPAAATNRQMIDPEATATGANGTVLVTNADVDDGAVYGGQGGLGPGCVWEPHAGASLPGIVFIQVFRKANALGQTCND